MLQPSSPGPSQGLGVIDKRTTLLSRSTTTDTERFFELSATKPIFVSERKLVELTDPNSTILSCTSRPCEQRQKLKLLAGEFYDSEESLDNNTYC